MLVRAHTEFFESPFKSCRPASSFLLVPARSSLFSHVPGPDGRSPGVTFLLPSCRIFINLVFLLLPPLLARSRLSELSVGTFWLTPPSGLMALGCLFYMFRSHFFRGIWHRISGACSSPDLCPVCRLFVCAAPRGRFGHGWAVLIPDFVREHSRWSARDLVFSFSRRLCFSGSDAGGAATYFQSISLLRCWRI